MSRRLLSILCCVCLFVATAVAEDPPSKPRDSNDSSSSATRDAASVDVAGIPKHHRYFWAIAGGAALGAGIGALLPPGSGKSATKGLLIGGSLASLLYLASHKDEGGKYRPWAWIATNATLVGGIGWSVCNCGGGFPVGAGIGGGFTAAVQAFEPRHHKTLSKYTGATPPDTTTPPPPPQQQQPPPQQPPQTNPPPPPPQSQPPQGSEPPPDEAQVVPYNQADNLPDSPQPKVPHDPPPERL
jgi:hypothetical protein